MIYTGLKEYVEIVTKVLTGFIKGMWSQKIFQEFNFL